MSSAVLPKLSNALCTIPVTKAYKLLGTVVVIDLNYIYKSSLVDQLKKNGLELSLGSL